MATADDTARLDFAQLLDACKSSEPLRGQFATAIPDYPSLPFFAFGPGTGAVVAIVGGQHGDEPSSVATAITVGKRLERNLSELNARILGLPVLNGPAFAERTRTWSKDGLDMNRLFDPPERQLGPTADVAQELLRLFEEIQLTFLLDLHAGGKAEMLTHIRTQGNTGSGMWSAVSANWVQRYSLPQGFLIRSLPEREVPAFTIEIGGNGLVWPEVKRATAGTISLLASNGWLDAPILASQVKLLTSVHQPRSEVSGLFQRTAHLGRRVTKGGEIGRLTDMHGKEIVVEAGRDGYLANTVCPGSVSQGTFLYELLDHDEGDEFPEPIL